MERVSKAIYDQISAESRAIWDQQMRDHSRMTNMKMTLAHNGVALRSYMEWYSLKSEIRQFLPERSIIIFSHALSTETDCLICSSFFRKILIDWGEDPDHLQTNETDQILISLARQIVKDSRKVEDKIFSDLRKKIGLKDDQIVLVIAFAGIMIATNIFNNVLKIPLDSYLDSYRK